jgi:hypothetical protein
MLLLVQSQSSPQYLPYSTIYLGHSYNRKHPCFCIRYKYISIEKPSSPFRKMTPQVIFLKPKSKSVNCERFKSGHCVTNTVWRNHRHDSLTSFRRRSKSDRKSKLLLPLLPAETIIVLEYTLWCQTAFATSRQIATLNFDNIHYFAVCYI